MSQAVPLSLWAKSKLTSKRTLLSVAEAYPRSKFQDWGKSMALFDRGLSDTPLEMKQWMSGAPLLSLLIKSALKGVALRPESRMQVRDMTAYDDQLAAAVMDLNASPVKELPRMAYVGTAWGGSKPHTTRVDNIFSSIRDHLLARQRSSPTVALGSRRPQLPPKPVFDESQRPTYNSDVFKITCPRANLELPILQSVYDQWSNGKEVVTVKALKATDPDTQLTWADIVLMHNNEFNPTGVPHKAKRQADNAVAALEAAAPPAVQLFSDTSLPGTLEEVIAQNLGVKVESGNATCSLVITKAGGVLIYAEQDGTLPHDEALFVVRGTPKTGEAAKKLMKDSTAWVEYLLSGEDDVVLTFATPLQGPGEFPGSPQPLNAALKFLEDKGHVKVQLYLHTVERDPTRPGSYVVKRNDKEVACMQVDIAKEVGPGTITAANVATHISVPDLKNCTSCKICQRIQFNAAMNKLQPGLPAVYLRGPVILKKGALLKLF